jgi:hypothetical protein
VWRGKSEGPEIGSFWNTVLSDSPVWKCLVTGIFIFYLHALKPIPEVWLDPFIKLCQLYHKNLIWIVKYHGWHNERLLLNHRKFLPQISYD